MANISKTYFALIILFTFFYSNLVSSNFATSTTKSQIFYADHCATFVPEPAQKDSYYYVPYGLSIGRHSGYYTSSISSSSSSSNTLALHVSQIYSTGTEGLFCVEASLVLEGKGIVARSQSYYSSPNYPGPSSSFSRTGLRLRGFWSESSGKACMVGGVYDYRRYNSLVVPAVFKLYNFKNSSKLTRLVTGTLESSSSSYQGDPSYFKPISFVLFDQSNYEYTLVSQELDNRSAFGDENGVSSGLPLDSWHFTLSRRVFSKALDLKYSGRCVSDSLAKKCSPLGGSVDHLPSVLRFSEIEISDYGSGSIKFRVLMKFPTRNSDIWDYGLLDPKTTLVGEGFWDRKKNQLLVFACRFSGTTDSWAEARVDDCSTRLSLNLPAIWTIGHTSSIVGKIWSNKSETDSGYFDKISFENSDNRFEVSRGLKYNYTKLDKAKKWCPKKKPDKKKSAVFTSAFSSDMKFDIHGESTTRRISWGNAKPLTVGDQFYNRFWHTRYYSVSPPGYAEEVEDFRQVNATNISYQIGISLRQKSLVNATFERWDISAEGVYDASRGTLCMIGCRNIVLNSSELSSYDDTLDCEILVKFQFPPRDSTRDAGFIKGNIESKRKKTDPLYFESFDLSSAAFVTTEAKKSIWRTDVEIIMALVFNTLLCLFTGLQLLHMRRNPDVLPYVSLTMLSTLAFGCSLPLLVDLKSMLVVSVDSHDVLLGSGGWFEAKGVAEGVTGLVLFLLQARLLQCTWSARSSDATDQTRLCVAEKEALVVSLPLYFGGAFLSIFFNWRNNKHGPVILSSAFSATYTDYPIWDALKSYAELLLDGFLLPQMLFNMFTDSRVKALSIPFYIGTTLVRILPHAYGLYKAQNSGLESVSTLWDVIIPFGSLIFAVVVYLQQKFGGRCILAFRSRESINVYEKVSNVVANAETNI